MSKYIKNPFVISGLFILFSIIVIVIFFGKYSRDSYIEQVQHRQQLSVRMGSHLIENLISSLGKSLTMISSSPKQEELDSFVNSWKNSGIVGISMLDKDGIVVKSANTSNLPDLGQNLSDREYFKWATKSEPKTYRTFEPVISRRGPSKGTYIIPIATAIFDDNQKFNGVLASAIPLSNLAKDYLNDLKVLNSSQIYLITSNGVVMFADDQSLLGKSYTEILAQDFLGKDKVFSIINSELNNIGESKFNLVIPNLSNKSVLEPYLIAMAPIQVNNQIWKMVVVTPQNELNRFVYNSLSKQSLLVFVISVLFIVVAIRYSRNSGYHDAVANEHKIHEIDQKTVLK